MKTLDGKSVIVTGAAQGLGRAYALEAARHGARLLLCDLSERVREVAKEIRAAGGDARHEVGPVQREGFAESAVDSAMAAYGTVDALINNAGIYHELPFWAESSARARALIEVNVVGAIAMAVACGRVMKERGRGAILNIASGASVGGAGRSAYSGSKGAIASLTRAWAQEGEAVGIRVNALAPVAATSMSASKGSPNPGGVPPELIAPLAAYLISDDASHLNGRIVRFDGQELMSIKPLRFSDRTVRIEQPDDFGELARALITLQGEE